MGSFLSLMRMEKKAAESALEAECANQRIACLCAQLLSGVQLLRLHELEPARLLCPWDFLGKNTGMG